MFSNVQNAYNQWAESYDATDNKTRDLDKLATQQTLAGLSLKNVFELGCGTGKNTEWLLQKAKDITAVDFSEAMLSKAKDKIAAPNVQFVQADITQPWPFPPASFHLATCNLILEHIENLDFIFAQAHKVLKT